MIKTDEISKILKRQLEGYESRLDVAEVGYVTSVGDGIARVYGLEKVMAGELLELPHDVMGLAFNLEEDNVGIILLGETDKIKEGDTVKRTGRDHVRARGSESMLGRVVDPLGSPIDGKGPIPSTERYPIERIAPGIVEREPVQEPMQTGLKAIDALIPIGRGQRELIIGDRQTGKTAVAVDTIINQKGTGVICIYVAIGQKRSTVAQVVKTLDGLRRHEAHHRGGGLRLGARPPAVPRPHAGCAMGEYFMCTSGKDTPLCCIYDDLSKQAAAYREISLLLRRPPGREAYPGDVFYLHCRLLERAAKLSQKQRRRLPHGPAHHRDPGRRRVRLHPHQRHLHHRRPDLPGVRPLQLGRPARR